LSEKYLNTISECGALSGDQYKQEEIK